VATGEEQDKVFQFIPEKDLPVFEFMRHYGCRVNKAIELLRENLFDDYFVISSILDSRGNRRASTKTKRVTVLPIIAEAKWIIDPVDPPVYVDGHKLVFGNGRPYTNKMLRRRWNTANRQAGAQKINLYSAMRHSFAMQRLNEGFALNQVSVVLGHSNLQTTVSRYAQHTTEKFLKIIKGKREVNSKFMVDPGGKPIERKRKNGRGERI